MSADEHDKSRLPEIQYIRDETDDNRTHIEVARLSYMDQKPAPQKPVVLVVEDDALIRLNAVDVLEDNGFAVEEASSAEDAIDLLETHSDIRLIFTDIQMPGAFDGIELARRVHARWPHIRLVITSGRLRPTRSEIPEDGRFIAKPYPTNRLLAEVNDLLHIA